MTFLATQQQGGAMEAVTGLYWPALCQTEPYKGGTAHADYGISVFRYPVMLHQIVGLIAVTATIIILLHGWEAPRWLKAGFLTAAALGMLLYGLDALRLPAAPAATTPQASRIDPPTLAFEGTWDALNPKQLAVQRQ